MTIKVRSLLHPRGKFEIYQDSNKEYRWHIISSNGKTIGASSEGFSSESYCIENAKLVLLGIADFFRPKTIIKKSILPKRPEKLNLFSNIINN